MPTENRSSTIEMVSFPRELSDDLAELIATRARVCGGGAFEIWEAICEGFAAPVPQPHPEPIAWMVGTAFWWTKEEAERDAAATGLPIVGLGPMSGVAPAEQHQGEPYGWAHDDGKEFTTHADHAGDLQREGIQMIPLYTHADPGEVERLRKELVESDHAFVRSATELAQCESMAAMVAEREWAEHLGTGTVSSKVEAAFTQLHNDLHEAGEKLAERDALLDRLRNHLIAKGVLGEFGPELFQILKIEAPERIALARS